MLCTGEKHIRFMFLEDINEPITFYYTQGETKVTKNNFNCYLRLEIKNVICASRLCRSGRTVKTSAECNPCLRRCVNIVDICTSLNSTVIKSITSLELCWCPQGSKSNIDIQYFSFVFAIYRSFKKCPSLHCLSL